MHPIAQFVQQPADVALFHSIKLEWKKILKSTDAYVKRTNVCSLVGQLFNSKDFSESIRSGFRACGLFPLDKNSLQNSELLKPLVSNRSSRVFGKELPLYAENPSTDQNSGAVLENERPPFDTSKSSAVETSDVANLDTVDPLSL